VQLSHYADVTAAVAIDRYNGFDRDLVRLLDVDQPRVDRPGRLWAAVERVCDRRDKLSLDYGISLFMKSGRPRSTIEDFK
jgi:hypothetical protein